MLHGHGNQILRIDKDIKVDFSSNIWYRPLNDNLLKHLQSILAKICDYPAVDAFNLQCLVSDYYQINDNQVCITSGATEAFYLISHAFQSSSSTILFPSFAEYTDAAKMYRHELYFMSNDTIDCSTKFSTNLVWIGNPNNPDGKLMSLELIEGMLKENPNCIFVVDEAYGELCLNFQSTVGLLTEYANLVVVKSVTKLCSIPGLRLGYILANSTLINKISAFRMPWSVSTIALEAGMYIFNHYDKFLLDTQMIYEESKAFQLQLNLLEDLKLYSSNTNYFLICLRRKVAAELKEFLINEYGFLIRDCANFYGLTENHFRLAIQGAQNNQKCVNAISNFLIQ